MNLPNKSKKPDRMMRTLFISQPIIFQSKAISKSDMVLETGQESISTRPYNFQTLESQSIQQNGFGLNTNIFYDNLNILENDLGKLRVLKPGQVNPLYSQSQKCSTQNIFQDAENEERKKFIDYTGIPRFEKLKQDKLIKYSVVGYQQFLKTHQEKKKQYDQKKIKNQNTNNGITEDSAIEEQLQVKTSQFSEKLIQQSRKTPKKNRGDQKFLNKRDLVQIMRDAEKRIQQGEKEQEEQERKLPQNIRNAITREQRSIKKHEEVKSLWENLNIQVASNCFRKPEETIMARSDQYREKNQMVQALELCKGDDEKNNSRYWYLRLRWYDHKDSRPPFTLLTSKNQQQSERKFENRLTNRFVTDTDAERLYQQQQFVLSDIQSNFNAKLVENPFKQVETVISQQKLKSQQLTSTDQFNFQESPKSKLYSTKLESMYHQKLKGKPKNKFADCQDYLSLTGENQFKRELRMLKREQQQEFKIAEIPTEEQELVINTWNTRNLAKSGEQIFNKWHERRLEKCLEFIQEITDNKYIPPFFQNSVCRLEQLQIYLKSYGIDTQAYELKDMIGRLGGFEDRLLFSQFQDRYLRLPGNVQKKEAEISFIRLLYEEIQLERQLDDQRVRIFRRWDYNQEILFNKLCPGSNAVDFNKMRKFFIRIRQNLNDEDIKLLLKRVGNGDGTIMSFEDFSQALKTQKQRAQEKIQIPIMKNSILLNKQNNNSNYMDKFRKRYKPLQTQQSFIQKDGCQTPRAKTPTPSRNTEPKLARTKTPNQLTEQKSFINENKAINNLMSIYLNQQRCLQNVMIQLDEVVLLKSLNQNDWHKQWQTFSVNSQDISYDYFINILTYYDKRLPFKDKIDIIDLPVSALTIADNLFQLLRDQELQLQKARIQYLKQDQVNSLDIYFVKGYMDVLDVFQILQKSTITNVSLQDAELIIARFNNFNGQKQITKEVFLNEIN
ncbi:unnamed protein product [Paramecium sonneborni]|uniref:Uncharacterized protein n=1 Tax=Paramecium sonneborni TaxID=65129 RepID=A0A8S1NUF0_9CILI|nr:unnamed protein product [Paramecium sonneborni]